MVKLNNVNQKMRGGRPASAVRFPKEIAAAIDKWGEEREISRAEAIRRLVQLGLTVKSQDLVADELSSEAKASGLRTREKQPGERKAARRAAELASRIIDERIAADTPAEEREVRRRRLLKGPSAFQDVRKDGRK
jgi:hypothetical protein